MQMSNNILNLFRMHLCGLGANAPTFTLVSEFKRYLISEHAFARLKADDLAIKFVARLEEIFDDVQTYFESAGVECPYIRNNETGCIHSYNHSAYITDIKWSEFISIEKFILKAEPSQLLLLAGLALICDGNFKVVVNDGTNDGGIDLIAKNKSSGYNCQITLAQVKKSNNKIGKEKVIYEHAYFWDEIIRKDRLRDYYNQVDVKPNSLALDVVYHFFTNNELSSSAISFARSRTIRIRYAREIAACLAKKYTFKDVIEWVTNGIMQNKHKKGAVLL
ncbi:restriction endonuclease [Enterobacter asburiae]|uniref:restriction endonuclease n=1 Tax=Enterobacter asburiae TaxID=61645 RepID=UPI00200401FF|nr:restriction endonuclease [Enterobacter asburiae]MCK7227877.1 restriction endonuclease [Enterobacter asburiae]